MRGPGPCAVAGISQLRPLGIRRHAPTAAELHVSHIVVCLKDFLVVDGAVTADGIVLGEGSFRTVASLVRRPIITSRLSVFPNGSRRLGITRLVIRRGLTPSIIVAIIFRFRT